MDLVATASNTTSGTNTDVVVNIGTGTSRKAVVIVGCLDDGAETHSTATYDPGGANTALTPYRQEGILNSGDAFYMLDCFYIDLADGLSGSKTFRGIATGGFGSMVTVRIYENATPGAPEATGWSERATPGSTINSSVTTLTDGANVVAATMGQTSGAAPFFTPNSGQQGVAELDQDDYLGQASGDVLVPTAGVQAVQWTGDASYEVAIQVLGAWPPLDVGGDTYTGGLDASAQAGAADLAGTYTPPTYAGELAAAAGAASAGLAGTFTPLGFSGDLAAQATQAEASFTGAYAVPEYGGSLSGSAGASAADFAGTYAPPEYAGALSAGSASAAASFGGTYVLEYAGELAAGSDAAAASFTGAYEPPPGGVLDAEAGGASAALAGTYIAPTYAGALGAGAGTGVADFAGSYAEPEAYAGGLAAIAGGADAALAGAYVAPTYTGALAAVSSAATAMFTERPPAQGYVSGGVTRAPALAGTVATNPAITGSITGRFGLFSTLTRRP